MTGRLHHYAETHHVKGKVSHEHVILAGAYGLAGPLHLSWALMGAYLLVALMVFFAHD